MDFDTERDRELQIISLPCSTMTYNVFRSDQHEISVPENWICSTF